MPRFYQYKGEKPIYRGRKETGELADPFESEEQFIGAGGTPYWRPDFTGESNVEMLDRPELPPVSPVAGSTPDLTTNEGLLAATEGTRPKNMAFSFDPMADIREELRPEAEKIEAAGLREEEAIKAGIASQVELTTKQYGKQINAVREQMKREMSGVEAISGARAGLGASTTLQANLTMTQQAYERRISEIEDKIEEAKLRGNIQEAAALATAAKGTKEEINKLYKDAWQMNMDMWNIQDKQADNMRANTQMDWDIMSKLSKDETWTSPTTGIKYTGVSEPEPFFTSSNIVSLMKSIPMGETEQIADPNTGEIWSVYGLGKPDINQKVMSWVDPNNNQIITVFDEVKGEIIKQVNGGKVRPPTPLISLGIKEEQKKELGAEEQRIQSVLQQNLGEGDFYTDPNIYLDERVRYSAGTAEFDRLFSPYLSPQERARLGVGKAAGVEAIEPDTARINELVDLMMDPDISEEQSSEYAAEWLKLISQ
jgi:hypothetical protein